MSFVKRAPDLTLWNIHARGRRSMPVDKKAMRRWLFDIEDRTLQLAEQIEEIFERRQVGEDFRIVAIHEVSGVVQVACPDATLGRRLGKLQASEGAVYALSPHLMGKA